jgi:hypothetical protein
MRSIEPGIQGFPDVQRHISGLVLTHHPGMTLPNKNKNAPEPGAFLRLGRKKKPERLNLS